MGVGLIRPRPGEVLHFSEDPSITLFVPHVARTAQQPEPYVWAVDYDHAPAYWFPRACPRALTWAAAWTTAEDHEVFLGASSRVHTIEYERLPTVQSTVLYAYRLGAANFRPFGSPEPYAQVATIPVRPIAPPEKVGSLLEAHEVAGIELRLVTNLGPYWRRVIGSSIGFSGIRLRNARPDPETPVDQPLPR